MPHQQIITDISMHSPGGSNHSSDMYKTSITDLYNTPSHGHGHGHGHGGEIRSPCVIRCTDILSHIKTCPVCSKLYMPIPDQGSGKWTCEDGSCYKTPVGSVSQKTVNICVVLVIIFILLLIKVIMGQSKQD